MDRRKFMIAAGAGMSLLTVRAAKGESGRVMVESPDGKLAAAFFTDAAGRLGCEVSRGGNPLIQCPALGVIVDGTDIGAGVELGGSIERDLIREAVHTRGHHTVSQNQCNTALVPVKHKASGLDWTLEVRAYNHGMAFKYAAQIDGNPTVSGEATAFTLPRGSAAYYQDNLKNYEAIWQESQADQISGDLGLPITARLPGEAGYVLITEADVTGYSGMSLAATGGTFKAAFRDDESWMVKPEGPAVKTPWRVVMAAENLNGLVNCDIVHNLSPDPDPDLFGDADEWIRPGRTMWSWWSEGTGGPKLQRKYVDGAAELGFEYILVDEGWEFWYMGGKSKWKHVAELVDYANAKGVDVWLWKRWKKLGDEDYRVKFFDKVQKAGCVGVKIDFMDSESRAMLDFYECALKDAARHRLMVNFHGANKPTGESRTYPNEMTREGIRGLEYNRFGLPLTPSYNATLPFTRLVVGHGDYTPVTFNPKKLGDTSYAHQLATAVVFTSPVTHYADKPENFLDNPPAAPCLDVLKSIPTVWDRTIVLDGSEIGKCAAFARRSGDRWFIGIINAEESRDIDMDLSFLGDGKYKAVALADLEETPAGFNRSDIAVDRKSGLKAKMRGGGGYVAMLVPVS
jgi:alpha-glucosidase